MIIDVVVRDPARFDAFMTAVKPTMEAVGGRHLAIGSAIIQK